MNKKEYVSPEMEITEFSTEDILIESNDDAVTPEMGFQAFLLQHLNHWQYHLA